MKRFLSKGKKGFTIVELVIVIGVIGILSAILIPTFVNLNANAQRAALKSDLAAVYSSYVADAADGYYGEKEDYKAPADDPEDHKIDIMYGQQDICLAKKADAESNNFYTYGEDGWNTDLKAKAELEAGRSNEYSIVRLHTSTADEYLEYSEYQVWAFVKNPATPSPLF